MKRLFFLLMTIMPLMGISQSRFEVLSGTAGVPFNSQELDSLGYFTNEVIEVIENYLPDAADEFKVYDFQFYIHSWASYDSIQDLIQLAVNAAENAATHYFLIIKEMSPSKLIEKVYIEFKFPSDSLPCLNPEAMKSTFEILANQRIQSMAGSVNPSYQLDYILLHALNLALSDAFCCSEYINSQNLIQGQVQRQILSCSGINQTVVNDLVEFLQSDAGYNLGLENLLKVIIWYNGCSSTAWAPLHPRGITPYCFWVGTPDPPDIVYSSGDLPFTFGCVDGLAVGMRNILDGLLAIPDLMNGLQDVLEAYTIYYVRCSGRNPTPAEMAAAWYELKQMTWNNSSFEENFDSIIGYLVLMSQEILTGARNILYGQKSNEQWCTEKEMVRNVIEALAVSLTNLDSLEAYYGAITEAFEDLWNDVDGIENEERYYQGCYLMSAAVEFVPISKVAYLVDFGQGLSRISNGVNGAHKLSARTKFIEKGSKRLLIKIQSHPDYIALNSIKQKIFDLDFGGNYTALLRILKGGYFKVWETLFDLPFLRTNVIKLQAVRDFAVTKNIDPSIIKAELQSLPGFKEDLIKGFEISNGTAQLPKIINKGDISTTGALHGSFINGQFVPIGNALPNGIMDFVALPDGQILLGTKHTFLSQGVDVLAAGTVRLTNGVVKDITNLSGHYIPNPGETMSFLRVFKNAGVNIDQSFLSIYKENGTIFKQVHINTNARKLYE